MGFQDRVSVSVARPDAHWYPFLCSPRRGRSPWRVDSLWLGGPQAARPLVATPTYVRTIGQQPGEASMYPSGVAVDALGDVVVADTGNDRIELFPPGSSTSTWSVGVRGGPESFQNPRDVAVNSNFVYVADTDDNTVQVLRKSDGSFVEQVVSTFSTPIGVSVGTDGSGNEVLLVSNGVSGVEDVFSVSGGTTPTFSLTHAIPQFSSGAGTCDAATNSHGNIYVADYRGGQLVKYSPSGALITTYGNGSPGSCDSWPKPYGVDVDSSGNVYIASSDLEVTVKINGATGACLATYGTKGTGASAMFQLRRVAVGGPSNLVYEADLWGLKIIAYNQNGTISTTQPELGTPSGVYPAAGGFNEPHGIAVTSSYVYVTDTVNQRMQRLDLPTGANPIAWGTKGVQESTAAFNWAEGIGVDPSGNVWVANTRNNRIDEFGPAGGASPTYVLGNRVGGGSVTFNWPMAVTFDPEWNDVHRRHLQPPDSGVHRHRERWKNDRHAEVDRGSARCGCQPVRQAVGCRVRRGRQPAARCGHDEQPHR